MLLNNFYQIIRYKCGITYSNTYKTTVIDGIILTNSSSVSELGRGLVNSPPSTIGYINYPGKYLGSSTAYVFGEVIISTDDSEPQRTDYKMDGVLTTDDLELYGASCGYNNSNMIVHSVTAKNTTLENITVNKIGLMINCSSNASTNHSALVYEELLKKPVTLKPDDVYTFTVQIG